MSFAPHHDFPFYYDQFLGPLFFEPFAEDLAETIEGTPATILELACGTGILTRHLASRPWTKKIVATDKEENMLQVATSKINNDEVNFQLADSQQLPFEDQAFELVICQFGFMFFGEKEKAFSEAFRTLRHGGQLLFNVWDQIKWNEISFIMDQLLTELTGKTTDQRKGPYSFYDEERIRDFLIQAGFTSITSKKVVKETKDPDPELIYNGVILGSPFAAYLKSYKIPESEIKKRLLEKFKPISGYSGKFYKMQALVFSAKKLVG